MERAELIEKIRKLLALARSPNQHEAAAALAKAQALMTAHDVSEAEASAGGRSDGGFVETSAWSGSSVPLPQRLAAAIVAEFFHVVPIRRRGVGRRGGAVDLLLAGLSHHVTIARYVFEYVVAALSRLTRDVPRRTRASFQRGVARGLAARLRGERSAAAGTALVPRSAAILRWLETQWGAPIGAARLARPPAVIDRDAYQSGFVAGMTLPLHDAVPGAGGGKPLPPPRPREIGVNR